MALLEVRGLVKYFGRRKVVDGVGFDVNPGEVVGLLGPNGAGKTTSFRMTTGQLVPNGGDVTFAGEDVSRWPMYRRARLGMGYLSQEQSIFRRLTVEQNILAILEAMPFSRSLQRRLRYRERWERTNAVLKRFNLEHVRHTTAARCSGGEKRRLEIARCLVCEPLLIMLDEPFAAVDPKTTEDIRANIRELAEQGIGILLTDHNVREVLKITDRSYLIKDGQVVTQGTPTQLINDPVAISAYLGNTFVDDGLWMAAALAARGGAVPAPTPVAPAPVAPVPVVQAPVVQAPVIPEPEPEPEAAPATLPLPQPPSVSRAERPSAQRIIEQEQLRRLVEALLLDDQARIAAADLAGRGRAALPALFAALERRDVNLRYRAWQVVQHILRLPAGFDPEGPEDQRAREVARLRETFERKAAG